MRIMKKSELASIQEDIKINMHCPVVGFQGTPLGYAFNHYIEELGIYNAHYICSLVYNLGMMHGKRVERARRKGVQEGAEMQKCRTNKASGKRTESEAEKLREYIDEMLAGMDNDKLDAVCFLLSGMQGGIK